MRKLFETFLLLVFQCIAVTAVFMGLFMLLESIFALVPLGDAIENNAMFPVAVMAMVIFLSVVVGILMMGSSSSRATAMRRLPFPTRKAWLMTTVFTLLGSAVGYGLSVSGLVTMPDYFPASAYVPSGAMIGGLLGYHIWSMTTAREDAVAVGTV